MTIFEGMLMAHLLGDWILQNEWQARNKARSFVALLTHVAIYHAVLFLILFYGFGLALVPVLTVVLALAFTHAILDGTAMLPYFMRTIRFVVEREPERWMMVAFDQAIHLLLLGAATLVLANWTG